MPTNQLYNQLINKISSAKTLGEVQSSITRIGRLDAQKIINAILDRDPSYTSGVDERFLNRAEKNLISYFNKCIQETRSPNRLLNAEIFQKIAKKIEYTISPKLNKDIQSLPNNVVALMDKTKLDFDKAYQTYKKRNFYIALMNHIFPEDQTVGNLNFSHLNRIGENENGQNKGFIEGTNTRRNQKPLTANEVVEKMSNRLIESSIKYNHIDENVRDHIIKPAFKHMLQELTNPDMSDNAKSQKLIILEGLALSLGNCNTPIVDYFVQANLGLLPKEKRVISDENLDILVEKIALKDRLGTELRKENLSFNNEAVEAMDALVSSIYKEDLPDNALKIDGGRKLPYSQSQFTSIGLDEINDAHKACLIKLVCKVDENGEPLKNEAGNPILDPKKMAPITSGARVSSGMENAQDIFAKKVSDFVMEKLNEEKYEPLMDLFYDPENYTNGKIPDVIKEKDQKDLFIEKCTEKAISDPAAVEAFFEEFKNDLLTKIDKELRIRKPEPSLQQEASLATQHTTNLSNMVNPINMLVRQSSTSSLTTSNSPTQSLQRQRNNTRTM